MEAPGKRSINCGLFFPEDIGYDPHGSGEG